jgi:hypothetical protein
MVLRPLWQVSKSAKNQEKFKPIPCATLKFSKKIGEKGRWPHLADIVGLGRKNHRLVPL